MGYGSKACNRCNEVDNEDHRINHCPRWEMINLLKSDQKIVFDDIYSDDTEKCLAVVKIILSMWDLENGKNEMRI